MSGTNALLADFVQNGSEQAFRDLVEAYLNMVYSTALRRVNGNRHLAEDISQQIFIDLAKKAARLPADIRLGGWLYRHTCFTASKALRGESRRKARELHAVELQVIADFTEENLGCVTPVLDEAINQLGAKDRSVVLLRFFEQLDFSSIGSNLGCTEDAARVRLTRALEKLGVFLRRRGVSLSGAALAFLLSAKATVAAPVGLSVKIASIALATSAKAGLSLALIKQACFTKLNLGITSFAGAVAVAAILVSRSHPEPRPDPLPVPKPLTRATRKPTTNPPIVSTPLQSKITAPDINQRLQPAPAPFVAPAPAGVSSIKVASTAPKTGTAPVSPLLKTSASPGTESDGSAVPKTSATNLWPDITNALWLAAMRSNRMNMYPLVSNSLQWRPYNQQQGRTSDPVPGVPTNSLANVPHPLSVRTDLVNESSDLLRIQNTTSRASVLRPNPGSGGVPMSRRPNGRDAAKDNVLP